MNLLRLVHTVRHLRARQIAAQASHRVRRAIENPSRVQRWKSPAFPGCRWRPVQSFLPPNPGRNSAEAIKAGTFVFLNHAHAAGFPPDWRAAGLPKLWRYNLHYHDFLWLLDNQDATSVAENWIARHPPARGAEGWESYPTSLRLMNWCMLFWGRHRAKFDSDPKLAERIWRSIHQQAEWLSRHLETHLLGNHLLENAAALALVGSCFAGDAAAKWFSTGTDLLREQLAEQILPDGGHFERSPMYHSRVVYLLAMLKNSGDAALSELVGQPLAQSLAALKQMCHPDGEIALFNDSGFGIYPQLQDLAEYLNDGSPAPLGAFALPDSGYFGARTADGSYILCDAGAIGPDYLPGHAHGDMLSFELSLRGHRVIVDSGVYEYEPGAMRVYCRSTRAHNTVELLGQDQCEFWGAFRVAKRGRVRGISFLPSPGAFQLTAEHDGYARSRKRLYHRRTFLWNQTGKLVISDFVTARLESGTDFISRLHLHPDCVVTSFAGRSVHVRYPAGQFVIEFENEGNVQIERSYYCPEFGQKLDNVVVAFSPTQSSTAMSGVVVRISPLSS
ncbi:N/A [soil metagenome]